jgi:RHS repeat-associated protein
MKSLRFFLTATLVTALFFASLSQRVWALDNASPTPPKDEIVARQEAVDPSKDVPIQEVTEKREANVKHFLTDNFRYVALVYPITVHYQENGIWKEIDNHLESAVDEAKNEVVENAANDVKVRFGKNTQSGKLVSIQSGNYGLSWSFLDIAKQAVQLVQPSDAKDNDITTIENLTSSVIYRDAFSNVDLEYVLRGSEVKENLILKSRDAQRSFSQVFDFTNLLPKPQEDGTILLLNDKGETIFRFERFLMVDAKGVESQDVQVTLIQIKNQWQLTITPNKEWLDDPERVYPVTLDPVVTTPISVAAIDDAHVTASLPNSNFYNSYILKTGYGGAIHRTYLKFVLPTLSASDMVIDATLAMSLINVGSLAQSNYQVNAHKVTGTWTETGLTWNNKPAYNAKIEDYAVVGINPNPQAYQWDITALVKEWYATGNNNGLILKDNNETTGYGYKEYYSADTNLAYQTYRPVIAIAYVNNNGLESYWTYHSQNVGRAGTGYTNDYNGNLVFIRQDTSGSGNRMPVSVAHVYNLNDRATDVGFGMGWRLNYSQTVGSVTIGNVFYYTWIDEDGTKHYFAYDSVKAKYMDEAGTQLSMTWTASLKTITDPQGNQIIFDSSNRLKEIRSIEPSHRIAFFYSGAQLTEIRDGVDRMTLLYYSGTRLIRIKDPDNKNTLFNYTGNNLTSVQSPDGKTVTYTYDSGTDPNKLLSATNIDGTKMTYTYSTALPYRVTKVIEENGTADGNELNFAYGNNATFFTDVAGRKEIYTFNNRGNTITLQDPAGHARYFEYYGDEEYPVNKNALKADSKLQKTVVNLLGNPSYETTDPSWVEGFWGSSTGTTGAADIPYSGNKSMRITKTNGVDQHFMAQTFTDLTPGKTYTFSAYVKTEGVSNLNQQGAQLWIRYCDASSVWQMAESKAVSGTQDWQRLETTFTYSVGACSPTVIVRAVLAQETGTAYFDALQLEEGSIANRYNLIENGDFTHDETGWSRGGTWITGDGITTITDPGFPSAFSTKGLKIQGEYAKSKNISQTIQVSGNEGDCLVFSAWAKSLSVPLNGSRYASLDLRFNYTDQTFSHTLAHFNPDTSEWQFLSSSAIAEQAFSSVTLFLRYDLNVNAITFDAISLFKEEFGQNYTYDDNGNVSEVEDLNRKSSSFEYTNNDLTSATDPADNTSEYGYDAHHNLTSALSAEGVKYSFAYDGYGNATSATIGDGLNGSRQITTSTAYTTNGNYAISKTDALGNSVVYTVNATNGLVTAIKDPLNHTVNNAYNSDYSLQSVSATVQGQTITNAYTYENDRLKTITHNGFAYTFVYDTFGNVSEVKVGTSTLITNSYQARTGRLNSFTYGNGDSVEYGFDSFDRIIGVKVDGILKTTYDYDANGGVGRVTDVLSGKSTRYIYDFANRLVRVEESNGNSVAFSYDSNNNASTFIDTVNGSTYTTAYSYDLDNRPLLVTSPSSSTTGYDYDVLGRLTSKKWKVGTMEYFTTYTYKDKPGSSTLTSTQLASLQNGSNPTLSYSYDANGNITSITEGANTIQYEYNELNEVIRENNQRDNQTFVYNYDLGGNLTSKVAYAYTTGTLGTPVDTIPYVYGDTNWKDLLTSFDGKAITYDAIGNPLTYDGGTFAWEGRKFTTYNKTGLAISYTYNENGIRTSKTVNGVTTNYRLSGDKVTFEQTGMDSIYYVYDTQGQLISMILNGVEYAYLRNAQNDIVGLIDGSGTQVVKYKYSTWGEGTVLEDTSNVSLGTKNPYRYRGYRFDSETGLYYLQSRYYNPQWGRFLNADDLTVLSIDQGNLLQYNNFTYCLNNPVNMLDFGGNIPQWVYIVTIRLVFTYFCGVGGWAFYFAVKTAISSAGYAYLSSRKYSLARAMFLHGMWGYGGALSSIVRQLMVNKLKSSPGMNNAISNVMKGVTGDTVNKSGSAIFDRSTEIDADLYYSLQTISFNIFGSKTDGVWNLTITINDTYDFDNIRSFSKFSFGNLANDLGWAMQRVGMMTTYKFSVNYSLRW